jgi:glycerophosphoryl diester phosphodiesterase
LSRDDGGRSQLLSGALRNRDAAYGKGTAAAVMTPPVKESRSPAPRARPLRALLLQSVRCVVPAVTLLGALLACSERPGGSAPPGTTVEAPPAVSATPDAPAARFAGVDLAAYLDCAREQGVALLQAHRAGDRPGAAENSLAAINASLADGAVFVEIDVARSADGILVLMHDDTVDRTTTGTGRVVDMTYDELATLSLVDVDGRDTGEAVPTLAEALAALDGRGFAQIDRKRSATFQQIAAAIEAADAADRTMVITYSIDEAIAFSQRVSGVMVSTGIDAHDDVTALQAAGVGLERVTAWLGLGSGRPDWDAELAMLGIETSYGDFRAEREGRIDYRLMADNGAEIISVDEVPAAAAALDAAGEALRLLQACPASRPQAL